MSKIMSWFSLSLAGMACLVLNALPAQAQNTRSWVSRFGSDASACTIGAPCQTFSRALTQTNAGGLINCLDAGDFGGVQVVITKAVTIDCTGTFAGVLVSGHGSAGFASIFITASATDVVTLRGLSIEGAGSNSFGVDVDR